MVSFNHLLLQIGPMKRKVRETEIDIRERKIVEKPKVNKQFAEDRSISSRSGAASLLQGCTNCGSSQVKCGAACVFTSCWRQLYREH